MKRKLVVCSDTLALITGLGKTALRIAKGFYDSGDYDVSYFVLTGRDSDVSCATYYGEEFKELFDNMKIFSCQLQDQNKYMMFDTFVGTEKPDIIISLLDPWNLDQIEMSQYRETFYWIAYCLFETPEYPEYAMTPSFIKPESPRKSIFEPLRNADLCIPVTEMGRKILDKMKVTKFTNNVYLGIDVDSRCKEEITKKDVFGDAVPDDAYVFMTVGRNSERKKLDKIIEAFSAFKKSRKRFNDNTLYKLYIHTDFNEAVGGTDLIALATELGVLDDVVFPIHFLHNQIMLDSDIYRRYAVSDAYIVLSAGEGFCYGVLEAMMHNKPVVYLDYGGHIEYCKGFGLPVGIKEYYGARNIWMKWALPDISDVVIKMNDIVKGRVCKNSLEFVQKTFDWNSVIIPRLLKIVDESYVEKEKHSFNLRKIV